MFTAIAYNYTFDTFYDDTDRICIVYADYVSGDLHSRNNFAFAPDPLGPAAEMAIRRIHGATINDILILISRGVLYYTFAAAITGSIFAVVIANKWQEDFFIKTTLSPMIFIIVSLILIITVTVTIIIQSLKIVSANPSDIVRNPIQ